MNNYWEDFVEKKVKEDSGYLWTISSCQLLEDFFHWLQKQGVIESHVFCRESK